MLDCPNNQLRLNHFRSRGLICENCFNQIHGLTKKGLTKATGLPITLCHVDAAFSNI